MRIVLAGCRPRPLASYLKALGIHRLVADQADTDARGWWEDDTFLLASRLDVDGLVAFLARDYRPSPIIAPWNGGSGFYPKDRQEAIERLRGSTSERFEAYRQALEAADAAVASLGLGERPKDDAKAGLVRRLRATLADDAIVWLDSVLLLGGENLEFPPLLGSGGNDGRLEFTNNFMQRLVELIDPEDGAPRGGSEAALRAALFGDAVPGLGGVPIGQFHPVAAGGANAGTGFSGREPTNPWEYVLMLEGALVFSASATRRGEVASPGLSYPFTVRSLTGGGSGGLAAADAKASRGEMWLPLWSRPARRAEIGRLFGEGRLTVGRRLARDGLDAARAIAALGVDRGFRSFERVAFGQRNGLAYLATSQGRFEVPSTPRADLAHDLDRDDWLRRLQRAAGSEEGTGALTGTLRRLDDALFDMTRTRRRQGVQDALSALGRLHRLIGASKGLREKLAPVRLLGEAWAEEADDGSLEAEVALALATLGRHAHPLRWNLYPLVRDRRGRPTWDAGSGEVVAAARLDDLLLRVAARRALWLRGEDVSLSCLDGLRTVRPSTLGAFLDGRLDRQRVMDLLYGLCLVRPSAAGAVVGSGGAPVSLPAVFSLVKLFLVPAPNAPRPVEGAAADPTPAAGGERPELDLEGARRAPWILARLAATPTRDAWSEVAERCRVWLASARGERFDPHLAPPAGDAAHRWAAALLLPISASAAGALARPFRPERPIPHPQSPETTPDPEGASA